MIVSATFLPRPRFKLTLEARAVFDHLFQVTPAGQEIDYRLPYPKWQFLCHICETNEVVLHGSQNLHIDEVEPRQAIDIKGFSNQRAIYATTDGIWAMYFAIVDRCKQPLSLFNSCFQTRISKRRLSDPMYFFSITQSALIHQPWCEGAVYILPRKGFVQEPSQDNQGVDVVFPHWIGSDQTKPIAKLRVKPQDFPFLDNVHGHNDEKLVKLAKDDPNGFPWPGALES
jgi:hypothetical protein